MKEATASIYFDASVDVRIIVKNPQCFSGNKKSEGVKDQRAEQEDWNLFPTIREQKENDGEQHHYETLTPCKWHKAKNQCGQGPFVFGGIVQEQYQKYRANGLSKSGFGIPQ